MQTIFPFPIAPCSIPSASAVPEHIRQFVVTYCGVNPKAIMTVKEGEPTKVYIFCDGFLQCVDFGVQARGSSVITSSSPTIMARDQAFLSDRSVPGYSVGPTMAVSQNGYVQGFPMVSEAETVEPIKVAKPSLKSEILRNRYLRAQKLKNSLSSCSGESDKTTSSDAQSKNLEVNPSEWHRLTDSEREAVQRDRRKANAYKTALCQQFMELGTCEYGGECRFAHGESELHLPPQVHPKYKTQLCNKFSVNGYCPYGSRCQFIHNRAGTIFDSKATLYNGHRGGPISKPAKLVNARAAVIHNGDCASVGKPVGLRTVKENVPGCGHQPVQKELSDIVKITHNRSSMKSPVWGTGHLKASTPKPCQARDATVNGNVPDDDKTGGGNVFSRLNFDLTNMLDEMFSGDNDVLFSQSCFPRLSLSPGKVASAKPR